MSVVLTFVQSAMLFWQIAVAVILLALSALLSRMGGKFSAVAESDAHLTFDSPLPASAAAAVARPLALPSRFMILVWNLKKAELPGLDADLPALASDCDLLILSEGYLGSRGRVIFDSLLGLHWEMGVSFAYKHDHNSPTGTLIGSRILPLWVRVKQTNDVEPIIGTPKCMTMARYSIEAKKGDRGGEVKSEAAGAGAAASPASSSSSAPASASSSSSSAAVAPLSLLVISIHGINAVMAGALDRQLEQAASEIRSHVGPVIFAGDFNTNLAVKVTRLRALVAELGMREVTFPAASDARKRVFGQVIDYVFTRGLRIGDARVMGHITSSDHTAMTVEMQLE